MATTSLEFSDLKSVVESVFAGTPRYIAVFDLILHEVLGEDEDPSDFILLQRKGSVTADFRYAPAWDFYFVGPEDPDAERKSLMKARGQAFYEGLEEIKRRIQNGPEWVRIPR